MLIPCRDKRTKTRIDEGYLDKSNVLPTERTGEIGGSIPMVTLPIHPRHHAYQAGKSTESALHQLVGRTERALDAKEYTLGVFKRGSTARGFMMWVERTLKVERTSAEGVEAAGQCTPSSWQRLRSGVVVWMHVFAWMVDILNINFEPLTFCCVLFVSSILVFVNVIDINIFKVVILVWNVLLLCLRLLHGMVAT